MLKKQFQRKFENMQSGKAENAASQAKGIKEVVNKPAIYLSQL